MNHAVSVSEKSNSNHSVDSNDVQYPVQAYHGDRLLSSRSSIIERENPIDTIVALQKISAGSDEAKAELIPVVYSELRGIAAAIFRRQDSDHTLQPTALAHEAYLRLVDREGANWESRAHFLAVAAKAMRQILINHARDKIAAKRGGEGWKKVTLDHILASVDPDPIDALAFEDALSRLAGLSERQANVVEHRI